MGQLFQGNDRTLLLLARKLFGAVAVRDARALDPRPTKSLSTRLLVIDDSLPELPAAAQLLAARVGACLDATS